MLKKEFADIKQKLNEVIALFLVSDPTDLAGVGEILNLLSSTLELNTLPNDIKKMLTDFVNEIQDGILGGNIAMVIAVGPEEVNSFIRRLESMMDDDIPKLVTNDNTNSMDRSFIKAVEMAIDDDRKNMVIEFLGDNIETLDSIENLALNHQDRTNVIGDLKSYLHTLKGEFGILGLNSYSKFIHRIEDEVEELIEFPELLIFRMKDLLELKLDEIKEGNFYEIVPSEISYVTEEFTRANSNYNDDNISEVVGNESLLEDIASVEPEKEDWSTLNVEGDPSLLGDFITESREHIDSAHIALGELEKDPENDGIINTCFRSCHTVKGVAGFLNLVPISKLAHALENVMDKIRSKEIYGSLEILEVLVEGFDHLNDLLTLTEENLNGGQCKISDDVFIVYNKLEKILEHDEEVVDNNTSKRDSNKVVSKSTEHSNTSLSNKIDNKISEDIKNNQKSNDKPQEKKLAVLEETIRVPVGKLDKLIDSIGEIVIAQTILSSDSDFVELHNRAIDEKMAQISLVMKHIQEQAMSLRMVSLKNTFQKMGRLVRDLSRKIGKPIEFSTVGEATELDKSVSENIGDPLVHMIRNSIDHGIETSEEREAAGKSRVGKVEIKAYHKSGNVVIEISDNGKGLDKDVLLAKAIKNKIAQEGRDYSEHEIFQFILAPGFSTAAAITDISGRGVGMDVVSRNIVAMRGTLGISSEFGKGTTFTIKLPLTMAIIDGFIVKSGADKLIIPTLSIISTVSPKVEDVVTIQGRGRMIELQGALYRFIDLSEVMGGDNRDFTGIGVAILVENIGGEKVAIWVDEILNKQQVVVKSMGSLFRSYKWISGGAVLGDGKVSLILDINELINLSKM